MGGGTPLIVKASGNTDGTLDHTWQEIVDAPMAWLEVAGNNNSWKRYPLVNVSSYTTHGVTTYGVGFSNADETTTIFVAESADGYPTSGGIG